MIRYLILTALVAGIAYLYGRDENVRTTINTVIKKVIDFIKLKINKNNGE